VSSPSAAPVPPASFSQVATNRCLSRALFIYGVFWIHIDQDKYDFKVLSSAGHNVNASSGAVREIGPEQLKRLRDLFSGEHIQSAEEDDIVAFADSISGNVRTPQGQGIGVSWPALL